MKKINRVILFLATKFNYRDYKRFGFDIIQRRGYKVEAWDFTDWYKPEYSKTYTPPDPFEFSGLRKINTINEAKELYLTLTEKDAVLDPFNLRSIIQPGRLNGCHFGSMLLGLLPAPQRKPADYLKKVLLNPRRSANYFRKKLFSINIDKTPLDFLITGGQAAEKDNRYTINKNTVLIKAHALDYDRYLEQEANDDSEFKNNGKYAVFLDEDMCFHPDYKYLGIEPYCSAKKYYPDLNQFFKHFENETGLNIIIAAHPRTDYGKRGNPFNDREIIADRTVELVKYSSLVLAHMSTSINFAVLYNKPVILLDSIKYETVLRNYISGWSSALNLTVINISKKWTDGFNKIVVDKKIYKEYKKQYIKEPGTPKKFVWEIFCDYLDQLNA